MITSLQPARIPTPIEAGQDRPAFLVGQDAEGHWLAVETHGLAGGIFRTEAAATRYALDETEHRPGAVVATPEPIVLRL
jgi:hypothetical protein